jgi:hypothetical protein
MRGGTENARSVTAGRLSAQRVSAMTGRRLQEDGEKRGLVTPIVHLLGEVLQTDEIEEKENEELDVIRNNRRSEQGDDAR